MHELSIAQSIFKTVLGEMEKNQVKSVEKIGLRIGKLSGILPDALEFSFDAIKSDTALAQTTLEMEIVPIQGKCHDCEETFTVEDFIFACPHCSSGHIEIERGQELEIAYLEV